MFKAQSLADVSRVKTRLCSFWLASGDKTCPHGDTCNFAHGSHELKKPTQPITVYELPGEQKSSGSKKDVSSRSRRGRQNPPKRAPTPQAKPSTSGTSYSGSSSTNQTTASLNGMPVTLVPMGSLVIGGQSYQLVPSSQAQTLQLQAGQQPQANGPSGGKTKRNHRGGRRWRRGKSRSNTTESVSSTTETTASHARLSTASISSSAETAKSRAAGAAGDGSTPPPQIQVGNIQNLNYLSAQQSTGYARGVGPHHASHGSAGAPYVHPAVYDSRSGMYTSYPHPSTAHAAYPLQFGYPAQIAHHQPTHTGGQHHAVQAPEVARLSLRKMQQSHITPGHEWTRREASGMAMTGSSPTFQHYPSDRQFVHPSTSALAAGGVSGSSAASASVAHSVAAMRQLNINSSDGSGQQMAQDPHHQSFETGMVPMTMGSSSVLDQLSTAPTALRTTSFPPGLAFSQSESSNGFWGDSRFDSISALPQGGLTSPTDPRSGDLFNLTDSLGSGDAMPPSQFSDGSGSFGGLGSLDRSILRNTFTSVAGTQVQW